jgi:alkylation response protein AidB-like acyl-CoA dehydrogenase
MDLRFTPEEIAFRDEARTFFTTEVPLEIRRKVIEGKGLTKEDIVVAHKALHKRGWATPNWPVDWGGCDWTPVQLYMYQEEMQAAGVPPPLPSIRP